jgi:RNA polymerase sigma-70 factor (ECF subfamily)
VADGRGASEAELEALYRRRQGAFLRLGRSLLGDPEAARDAVQEAFALALRARRSFRGTGSLDGWVWRTFVNVCREQQRRRTGVAAAPVEPANGRVPHEDVRGALETLTERERLVVFLRYFADLSYDDIGEALGVRRGTVAATLNHAHTKLRDALQEEVQR